MRLAPIVATLLLSSIPSLLPAAERAALVFGNRDYPERSRFPDLRTVEEDARVMHGLLKAAGFRVGEGPVLNASRTVMEDRLIEFAASLKSGDEAVVYFAGHGVQYENKVWLMGSNAEFLIKSKLGEEAVSHETVAGLLGERGVKIAVILLDCCREVPDQSWLASEVALRGLRGTESPQLHPPPNILVGFATSSERLTNDNLSAKDVNGPLVAALQRHWDTGLEFDSLWKAVAKDVYTRSLEAAAAGKGAEIQMPSKYGQTIHDFFFMDPPNKNAEMAGPKAIAESSELAAMRAELEAVRKKLAETGTMKDQSASVEKNQVFSDGVGTGRRGFLGVLMKDIAEGSSLFGKSGVIIEEVGSGSPAEKALKPGDLVVAANGTPATGMDKLRLFISNSRPGTVMSFDILRLGKPLKVSVVLGELDEAATALSGGAVGVKEPPAAKVEKSPDLLKGVRLRELDSQTRQAFGLDEKMKGVAVESVQEGSAAAEAGLKAGDVITEVDQEGVANLSDANKLCDGFDGTVLLLRAFQQGRLNILAVPVR